MKGFQVAAVGTYSNLCTSRDRDATEFSFCPGDCTRQCARAYSSSVPFDLSNSQSVDPKASLFNPLTRKVKYGARVMCRNSAMRF